MIDIVERLRLTAPLDFGDSAVLFEAADEIEQLRDVLASFVHAWNAGTYRGLHDAARQARNVLKLEEEASDELAD